MNDLLQTVIFARYTVQDLLLAFGAAIALFVILGIARRLRGTSKDRHFENVNCPDCSWRGKVSRYAGGVRAATSLWANRRPDAAGSISPF